MKEFGIHISLESFQETDNGIGEIYVLLDDYAFPEIGWTDFGFNIIFWWMLEFKKLWAKESTKAVCKFMDGNYRYDVTVKDSTSWKFKFVRENADKDEIWQEGEVDSNQATEILLSAINLFMNERHKEGNSEKLKHWAIAKQELIEARKK